jgi:hypothetical protein
VAGVRQFRLSLTQAPADNLHLIIIDLLHHGLIADLIKVLDLEKSKKGHYIRIDP